MSDLGSRSSRVAGTTLDRDGRPTRSFGRSAALRGATAIDAPHSVALDDVRQFAKANTHTECSTNHPA